MIFDSDAVPFTLVAELLEASARTGFTPAEIEALVVLQRRAFRFEEVPVKMHPRTTGRSSITALKSLYYIVHVLLGVFVNVLKYDSRLHRARREKSRGPGSGVGGGG